MQITNIKFQYFNRKQNLYITAEGSDIIPKFNQFIPLGGGKTMHVGENNYGVVSFVLWCDQKEQRPGHGGFWSSRPSVVGPLIGKRLIDVAINGVSASMQVEVLEQILPEEFHIVERPNKTGNEISFEVQRKDGQNSETPYNQIIGNLAPSYHYG